MKNPNTVGRSLRVRAGLAAAIAALALLLAACGSSSKGSGGNSSGGGASSGSANAADSSGSSSSSAVAHANAVVAAASSGKIVWKGPTSSPPLVKNKTIAIVIETGDEPDESSVRSWKGLQAATAAVGWKAIEIAKPNLNDSFIQAVQLHVSGIITWGANQTTKEGLEAAKKAGIPVIAAYTAITPQSKQLFTHVIDQSYELQGEYSAASVVALTGGKAKIGLFTFPPDPSNPSSIDIELDAFKSYLSKYGGGQIVASTVFNPADLGTPSALSQQAVAFYQAHPEVNVAWTPFAAPAEDIDQALISAGLASRLKLFTFEGSSVNLGYLRRKELVVADVAAPIEWMSWAAVDDFNRIFNKAPVPANEGLPIRLITASNVPAAGQDWTGEFDYESEDKKIWGLG